MKTKITCVKTLEFDTAHRVMNHESKCANLHGHRYKAEIHACAPDLDHIGRVIDFSVIKSEVGSWIDNFWDHTSIIYEKDTSTIEALYKIPRNKEFFISNFNPTAENMAKYLLLEVCPRLLASYKIIVTKVVIHETPTCFAEAILDEKI